MRRSAVLFASLVACSDGGDASRDGAPAGDRRVEARSGDASGLRCPGDAGMLPSFDKSCTVDADCVVAQHTLDCCGTLLALGLNKAEQTRFQQAEQVCARGWPPCGCAPGPTQVEDGSRSRGTVGVKCVSGSCRTYDASCGGPCASGLQCFACHQGPKIESACAKACQSASECTDATRPNCAGGVDGAKFCAAALDCAVP